MTMQRITALTMDMERFAAAAEWDRVLERARRRDALLRDYTGEDRQHMLTEALRVNESILQKIRAERSAAAEGLAQLRRGRQSVSQYAEHQEL